MPIRIPMVRTTAKIMGEKTIHQDQVTRFKSLSARKAIVRNPTIRAITPFSPSMLGTYHESDLRAS